MKRYGKIKPLLSDHKWIRETDWLRLMVDAARARGLRVGAEVSHFPIPKALIRENPQWQMRTIDGRSWSQTRFCPNNPVAREYVIALFGDLAANYAVIVSALTVANARRESWKPYRIPTPASAWILRKSLQSILRL